MRKITVYNPQELKDKFPEAFNHAFERWQQDQTEIFWADDIMESLKGLFKASGIRLWDYSIGAYNQNNYVRFEMSYKFVFGQKFEYDAEDFIGQKAYTWIKANILDGAKFKRVNYPKKFGGKGWRYDITKKNGDAWSCEFTGYCADHDFIESLLDDIKHGCTLKDALHNLADIAGHLMEQELEYQQSEEEFLFQDHLEYTEDGRMI